MATPASNEDLVHEVFAYVRDKLDLEQMTALNKRLVTYINRQAKLRRAASGADLDGTKYVKFTSRTTRGVEYLEVEKVTPGGVVYGTSSLGVRWKMSANLCVPVDRTQFEASRMVASVTRTPRNPT